MEDLEQTPGIQIPVPNNLLILLISIHNSACFGHKRAKGAYRRSLQPMPGMKLAASTIPAVDISNHAFVQILNFHQLPHEPQWLDWLSRKSFLPPLSGLVYHEIK